MQALHPVFNISRLKPYVSNSTAFASRPQRFDRPPPEVRADSNGDALWVVDRVLACKKAGRGKRYLVAWKGYPPEENTWEPHASISHTTAFEEFQAAQRADDAQAHPLDCAAALTVNPQAENLLNGHQQPSVPSSKKFQAGRTKSAHLPHRPLRDRRTPQAPLRRIRQSRHRQDTCVSGSVYSVMRARSGF
jgi:hypothetical protein